MRDLSGIIFVIFISIVILYPIIKLGGNNGRPYYQGEPKGIIQANRNQEEEEMAGEAIGREIAQEVIAEMRLNGYW